MEIDKQRKQFDKEGSMRSPPGFWYTYGCGKELLLSLPTWKHRSVHGSVELPSPYDLPHEQSFVGVTCLPSDLPPELPHHARVITRVI
jgi:hypothetical protein